MNTLSYSAVKADLAKTFGKVRRDRMPIAVHQKEGDVVLMCREDYEAWEETVYLLRSPRNAKRLADAMKAIEKGRGVNKSLQELVHEKH